MNEAMNPRTCHSTCRGDCGAGATEANRPLPGVTRREFVYRVGALSAGGLAVRWLSGARADQPGGPQRHALRRLPLKVQPVLTCGVAKRGEATSWREWGGIQTEEQAIQEQERIAGELGKLKAKADFPLEVLPVATARTPPEAADLAKGNHDVLLMYAGGGPGRVLEAMTLKDKWNLMFLRPRLLGETAAEYGQPGLDVEDVVRDSCEELLWRLRALSGLKHTLGKRIVAIGGAGGCGAGGQKAPAIWREVWKLDIRDYAYDQLGPRLKRARQDDALVRRCQANARQYLAKSGTTLQTSRRFVDNAFVLLEVLKDIMEEAQTDALTVNSCMGTIMPTSETTACLPLSLLNDEGYAAFCESDFVVIPSGILLHYISDKPVFLNDPTYPHANVVTLAHCTAPRKMDGKRSEKAKIVSHFESDYGAALKVEMKLGQQVTNLVPDFACKKWVGFDGTIVANPLLDICRSQIDVQINGDGEGLMEEMKGFHWMTCYGGYLRETGYALRKLGVDFLNLSQRKAA
jgi:hypothetical protein